MKPNIEEKSNKDILMLLRNFIFDMVVELWEGDRLRDRLIFALFFGVFLLLVIFVFTSITQIIIPFLIGSFIGILFGWLTILDFFRKIRNNFYPWIPLKRGVILGVIIILFSKLIDQFTGEFYRLNYFYLPMALAFPISILISLHWLIKYEKEHGTVYIVRGRETEETSNASWRRN